MCYTHALLLVPDTTWRGQRNLPTLTSSKDSCQPPEEDELRLDERKTTKIRHCVNSETLLEAMDAFLGTTVLLFDLSLQPV